MKSFISIFFIVFTISLSYSQTYFGIKVGGNYSNLFGDIDNAGGIGAVQVGGFADIKVKEKSGIQVEMIYSMQGYFNKETSIRHNLNYVNANFFYKYYLKEYFTIDVGPQIGYLIGSPYTTGTDEVTSNIDLYNKLNFGIGLGSTYSFDDWLIVGLHYHHGFSDVIKHEDSKGTNSVLQLSFGYKF